MIKAPITGSIEQMKDVLENKFINVGEIICVISPDTDLIGEVCVSSKNIGLIKKGNKVNLLIDSFNYNDWGSVKAEVVSVSEDYLVVDNKPVFKVICKLREKELKLKNGFKGKLKKGMTFQARFFVAERSVMQLLFDNINNWLNPYKN